MSAEVGPHSYSIYYYRDLILRELQRLGDGSQWLWVTFVLLMTPGILNGIHALSYVFIGQLPDDYWCAVPDLMQKGWNRDQIQAISTIDGNTCKVLNWDYNFFSNLTFEEALEYVFKTPRPEEVSCLSMDGNYFFYEQESGVSIVMEWDLVCDNLALRSSVQMALSLGKFIGATLFGILADRFGRKMSFTVAAILYMAIGPAATFTPWYWLFLISRFIIGLAGSGVYHSAYTILTEITTEKTRYWLTIVYSISYPIGMLILALFAYFISSWRYLQLAISIPAFLLIIHIILLPESPRWLLNKNRYSEAYEVVFGEERDLSFVEQRIVEETNTEIDSNFGGGAKKALKQVMFELNGLFGTSKLRNRLFICYFAWCVSSLCYYAIALNAENFSADRLVYVTLTGLFEVPSYIIPCFILRYLGRKETSLLLFWLGGFCLLILLAIPADQTTGIVILANFGRLCISAVFVVVMLHTSELFPTEIRNSAIGTSSTMAHVGSISAPYLVDFLGLIAWYIPSTVCGILAILAGAFAWILPETRGKQINDTVDEEINKSS